MKPTRQVWKKTIAAALSLSLLAAALALLPTGAASLPRDWIGTASRPFLRLVSLGNEKIQQGVDYFRGVKRLQEENAALREELAHLRPAAQAGELAQGENARLRSLLSLAERGQELTLTSAWVIARTPDNWSRTVTLDQGTDQNVQTGQCVIDQAGALVGRVTETGGGWCTVALVSDPDFQAAGQACRSGVLGALEGDLTLMANGELKLSYLTKSDPVALGETVVTFASADGYPSGLTVGTVTSLEDDPGGLTRSAVLTPAAELDSLSQVFIVTGFWEVR